MENNVETPDNRPEWLKQLTETSWNVELIISGAAIFLASYLPDAVEEMLRYYLENLATTEDVKKIMLPLMAYSFFKVVAWILVCTFVVHFIMRAFWAGVVGLHAVYAEGIRYEHIPWQTDETRGRLKERFGSLAEFIRRLDRASNQLFALAFLIALISLGIAIAYMFIFLVISILPLFLGKEKGRIAAAAALSLLVVLALLPLTVQLLGRLPRFAGNPALQRMTRWTTDYAGNLLMPLVHLPTSYLNMTFASNVSRRRYSIVSMVLVVILILGVLATFWGLALRLNGRLNFHTQQFYARTTGRYTINGAVYDNMRAAHDLLPPVSIPSDIAEGPFLRVFVQYPKALDAALSRQCVTPALPDSLPRRRRMEQIDGAHIACISRFFRVSVNDSLLPPQEWFFQRHPVAASPGLVAYISADLFKKGKNILRVEAPSVSRADSLRIYGEAPFWYAPK